MFKFCSLSRCVRIYCWRPIEVCKSTKKHVLTVQIKLITFNVLNSFVTKSVAIEYNDRFISSWG